MIKGSYDSVAPFYDQLSRVVFGNAINKAQSFLVNAILPGSHIVIVGGGSGKILEEICEQHTSGLQIVYVEASQKMTALATKRNTGNNQVTFIAQPLQEVNLQQPFNVVITPFFFDNFNRSTIAFFFAKLNRQLLANGLWLIGDFRLNGHSLWQKILLAAMYRFFRPCCGIEANQLIDMRPFFSTGYTQVCDQTFYNDFIYATVHRKRL